jgi:hypothetical protein
VQYRTSLLQRVARDGLSPSKIHVLEALLRLRQAASHIGLVHKGRTDAPSAKFDVLIPRLIEVIDEGHKALVFSQFTSLLALLRAQLAKMPDNHAVHRLKADVLAVDAAAQLWDDHDRALVWMYEDDGDRRTFRLPGISNRVVIEIISLTLQRNPNLRLTLLVPFDTPTLQAACPEP